MVLQQITNSTANTKIFLVITLLESTCFPRAKILGKWSKNPRETISL
jgi:hypothetical protein